MTTIIDLGKLRFYWAGDYVGTTEYELNDVVKYGGNVYVYINVVKTIGNEPTDITYWALMVEGVNFVGEWDAATQYFIGDAVAYGGTVYVSLSDNINEQPDINPSIWSTFVDGIQYEGVYSGSTTYQPNDVVSYGPGAYIAIQTTSGHDPSNNTYWTPFVSGIAAQGVYNPATAYVAGDIVAYGANLYIATNNTTGNLPTDTGHWTPFLSAFENRGAWATATLYYVNDLVQYGANTYACQVQNTSGVFATDLAAGKWSIFVSGLRQRGDWTTATQYLPYDIVVYGGNTYSCVVLNTSGVFATDLAAGKWQIFNGGIRWRGEWAPATDYLVNDVVRNLTSSYICTVDYTSSSNFNVDLTAGDWQIFVEGNDVFPPIPVGGEGSSLTIDNLGAIAWINASGSTDVFYVSPDGDDANPGTSLALPFASIQAAVAAASAGNATIFVKTGTYSELALPIIVPQNTAIVGDNQRTVNVQPGAGFAADGITPNNQSMMFAMSNGSILNKMTFKGMTGWVPGTTADDITTSTIKGIVVGFNPASPVTSKSPYVLECAAICSGAVGAYVDGSAHALGFKSMLFHGYTVISDLGVGYYVKDQGKAEIVSCFTYYCYFGYATSGGGFIRALNGNNSYGHWGVASRGYDTTEVPVTGNLYGIQLQTTTDPINTGFIAGSTVTGVSSGATAIVTNLQSNAGKVYVKYTLGSPVFTAGETINDGLGNTLVIATGGVTGQEGVLLVMDNLTAEPLPGASIQIAGDTYSYVIQSVSGTYVNTSSVMYIALSQEKPDPSADGTAVTIRYKYSQIRLTGHDFLDIGTGGVTTTNYPNTPLIPPAQGNEVDEVFPGRCYYVSTDQNGNFRVGEYFTVDQGTGTATLNANAFNLSGLTSLQLGSIGAQLGETINEFSSDVTMGGLSPTNLAVPTEYAVSGFVTTQIGTVNTTITNYPTVAHTYSAKQTFNGSSSVQAIGLVNAAEKITVSATAATGTINYDVTTQSILYYTTAATGNWTMNVRGSSGTSLDTLMAIGESMTFVFMNTNTGTAYYPTSFQVDGTLVAPKWQGGTAPSSGNASAVDVYSYTVIKTASATYTVLASQTKFA